MTRDFLLPDLGEGLTESELVAWHVAVGQLVELNQPIAEVETAKAIVQLPSPFAGVIAQLYVEEGSTVAVGTPIVAFELDELEPTVVEDAPQAIAVAEAVAEPEPAADAEPVQDVADAPVERNSVLVGYGPRVETGVRPERKRHSVPASEPVIAKTSDARPRETRIPIRGVRKATADAMVRSAFTAPHVTEFLTVDVTATLELIEHLREKSNSKVTLLAVVSKALCIAVRRNPSLNSSWDDSAGEIVEFGYVNLGIAVATPRGLLVPNIRDADAMGLAELTTSISDLAETARNGTTTAVSLTGGTISISNVGVFGVDAGTPIVNPGEAAILAMGAVRREPREHNGEIALRDAMTLSLSFDHRLVDGEQGSRLLTDIGAILTNPGVVLAMV
ncbi:MAG TPA: dihydrolipoamide acetyltransferase family protein [Galbitalea sp.]|jgi:pyruvate dehydrogenase E2 component (dihydrolipoamide acetyltransferase)